MSMEPAISFEDLDRRRRRASEATAARKASIMPQPQLATDSVALAVINEIFNPTLKLPVSTGPYKSPVELNADDKFTSLDVDNAKLAELKEVFLLFDTDCDGLISKDDLRFTLNALGSDANDDLLEQMMKEAKDPLDFTAFVELMFQRTIELDSEDDLLEAWSKWDDYGTGKIEERNCLDIVEVFPHLRESVIENTTLPEYVWCNRTANIAGAVANVSMAMLGADEFIYSAGKTFGLRLTFQQPTPSASDQPLLTQSQKQQQQIDVWRLNLTAEYRFLKRDNFKTDGRLIAGTYCDYYFFANTDVKNSMLELEVWRYFHSPRFPAKYPAHIKCAYKFIGRPESRVEIVFEELQLPKLQTHCNLDALTIFDAEAAHMNAVIDVLCAETTNTRRIISSGPDLLIEFNASSNVTAKGFRGKYKFLHNEISDALIGSGSESGKPTEAVVEAVIAEKTLAASSAKMKDIKSTNGKQGKEECKLIFDSRVNKSGIFETSKLFAGATNGLKNTLTAVNLNNGGRIQCRYDFYGFEHEKIQIKFLDFNIPTESQNSSACKQTDSLQVLTQVMRGKYEVVEHFCGAFLPKPIMSPDPKLTLQFLGKYPTVTNKVFYYGFRAEYKFLTNFGINSGVQQGDNCTFMYNSTDRKSGSFHSPNFPGFYLENIVCNYYFYGEKHERIVVRFMHFDVEGVGTCEYLTASDYVEFSNFMSTDRKYPKYCGKLDSLEIRSDGRFFRVTLSSNDRFVALGFRALYEFEPLRQINESDNASMQSFVSSTHYHTQLSAHVLLFSLSCQFLNIKTIII